MNRWEKIYQEEKDKFSSPLKLLKNIVCYFKKKKVKFVLDLGCGVGKHSFYLAKNGFKVVGFDISNEAIKLAKERLNKEMKLSLKFFQGSMHKKFPFKDNSFDGIISLRTINHGKKEQIKKTVSEIYRVLKNGGYIFVTIIKIDGRKNILGKTKLNNLPVKIIAPYTYIPQEGKEKGIVHFMFNKKMFYIFFKKFKIIKLWLTFGRQNWDKYYCLLALKP